MSPWVNNNAGYRWASPKLNFLTTTKLLKILSKFFQLLHDTQLCCGEEHRDQDLAVLPFLAGLSALPSSSSPYSSSYSSGSINTCEHSLCTPILITILLLALIWCLSYIWTFPGKGSLPKKCCFFRFRPKKVRPPPPRILKILGHFF